VAADRSGVSADERVGTAIRERLAADLAVRGGRLALEYFHRAQVSWKADGSMLTDADLAIQAALTAEIARVFPDDAVIGEEGRVLAEEGGAHHAWVLDPVDGTNNFGRGLPGFSVSIGVLRNLQPFAGAVYDPISRWLFTACIGRGAWLNDRPLRTRPAPLTRASLVSIRTPMEEGTPPFVEEWLRRYRLRRFGSTALHLCYVALGALDLVHDDRASLWDVAGAAPVLLEAGGLLGTPAGGPLFPVTAAHLAGAPLAFLAGNPGGHAQALADIAAAAPLAR
jgi:myo-inositol-1(or 4)-monophosphatase